VLCLFTPQCFGTPPGRQMIAPQATMVTATRIHVDKLSDEQLLTAIIKTNDPMNLDGIQNVPPADDCPDLWFEMNYEADANAKCVFGHSHRKGIILRDAAGLRYPIGHTCGKGRYGLDWNVLENAIDKIRDRKEYLIRLQNIGNAIKSEEEWLSELSNHPAIAALDRLHQTFAADCRALFAECVDIARGNGTMWADVDERDYAAEERRRERDAERDDRLKTMTPANRARDLKKFGVPGSDKTPIYMKVPRSMGVLAGLPVFRAEPLKPRIKDYVTQIRLMADTCLQLPNSGDLPGISKLATRTFNDIASALDEINEAAAFFNYANLARVVEWANKRDIDGLKFSVDGAALRVENGDEQSSVRIARPVDLAPIQTGALSNLLASLLAAPR
jgi:hypothetical protein